MEPDELISSLPGFLRRFALPLLLATLGVISLGYGLITLSGKNEPQNDIVFESAQETVSPVKKQLIIIDVQGAVLKPGVYSLPEDSRVQDALIAAGGMSTDANREWIAKSINLAGKLADGTKLYLPFKNEAGGGITAVSSQGVIGAASGQVNINTATTTELEALPGIGGVTAGKIISGRPYASPDELQSKKIVGKSVYEKIKDKVTVY